MSSLLNFSPGLLGPVAILSNTLLLILPHTSTHRHLLCGFLIQVSLIKSLWQILLLLPSWHKWWLHLQLILMAKFFTREVRNQKLVIFSFFTISDFFPFQARTTIGFVYSSSNFFIFFFRTFLILYPDRVLSFFFQHWLWIKETHSIVSKWDRYKGLSKNN